MLNLVAASGYNNYFKSCRIYVQQILACCNKVMPKNRRGPVFWDTVFTVLCRPNAFLNKPTDEIAEPILTHFKTRVSAETAYLGG